MAKVWRHPAAVAGVPLIAGTLPWLGAGLSFIGNPRAFLEKTRAAVGDTFVLYIFGFRLFFVFGSDGLRSLYRAREADASFTEATRTLLSLKLPSEALGGQMLMFHRGLRASLLNTYIGHMDRAMNARLEALGSTGDLDVFPFMKEVGHRMGLLCWVGPEAVDDAHFGRLVDAFEACDPEEGFQSLSAVLWTQLTRKRGEKAALKRLGAVLEEIWDGRVAAGDVGNDNLTSLFQLHAGEASGGALGDDEDLIAVTAGLSAKRKADLFYRIGINVFQFHLASLANMYAAAAWTLINVLSPRDVGTPPNDRSSLDAILGEFNGCPSDPYTLAGLETMTYTEAFVDESLRLAQQSITLRKTMRPISFAADGTEGSSEFNLPKGFYVATLLSINNADEALNPSRKWPLAAFHPERYLDKGTTDGLQYAVSTFGHGFHACPGRRFAMCAIKLFVCKLLTAFEMDPQWSGPVEIPPGSIGAMARAAQPCVVSYRRR